MRTKLKRYVATLLAFVLLISSLRMDVSATTAAKPIPALTGNQAYDAANIAASQIGYDTQSENDNIYAKEIGGSNGQSWCTYFVTWCVKKAGLNSADYPSKSDFSNVTLILRWFKDKGLWHRKNGTYWYHSGHKYSDNSPVDQNYVPKTGDLIILETMSPTGPDHIGIVEKVSNGYVTYIHGNTGNDTVDRTTYSLTNTNIWGYCSPNYNKTTNTKDNLPTAVIDSVTGGEKSVHVSGWAFDVDSPSKELEVHVYIGGPAGSANVEGYKIIANKERKDVNQVYGTGNYHGYDETITVNKTGTQEVYIYAINANSDKHLLIGHKSVFIKKANSISFPSETITLDKGQTKTVSFDFAGDGIYSLSIELSNDNITTEWGAVDWTSPKADVKIQGLKEGTTSLKVNFLDTDFNVFYSDSVTVKVNHVHEYTTTKVTKQPTCTTQGTKSYVCSCGVASSSTISIPATGHTIVSDVAVAATCTTNGKTAGKHCSVCKTVTVQQNVISATGHQGGTATCTSKAKCNVCGESYGSYGSHDYYTSWTIDKNTTCTSSGLKSYHCKNCSDKKDITSIPATGHQGGTATCSQYAKCSVCGESYGNLKSHVYSDSWTIDKQATCIVEGSKSHHCVYCDLKKDITSIPATGHSGDNATCSQLAKCDVCGEYYGNYAQHQYVAGECIECGKVIESNENNNTNESESNDNAQNNNDSNSNTTNSDTSNGNDANKEYTDSNESNSEGTNNKQEDDEQKNAPSVNKPVIEDTILENDKVVVDKGKNEQELNNVEDENSDEEEVSDVEVGDIWENENTADIYEITSKSSGRTTVEYLGREKSSSTIVIPDSITIDGVKYQVTSIAEGAFENNNKLTKIVIGDNVVKIGKEAFSKCKNLRNVTIGKNVTQIGDKAFYMCTKITKITIPENVNKIGKYAFYGCRKLKTITIKSSKLTSNKVGAKAFKHIYSKATIIVPKDKAKMYKKMLRNKGVGSTVKVKA